MRVAAADAARWEALLGSVDDEANVLGWAQALTRDEGDFFPEGPLKHLHGHGLFDEFIPISEGGRLDSVERLSGLFRVLARRDLSTAVALGPCLLGGLPIWLEGSASTRRRAASILKEGQLLSLALTEEAHGTDLLANEVTAVVAPDGYRLAGTKWAINNATRGAGICVLASSRASGGVAGQGLFFLDRERVPHHTLATLPKFKTVGVRGVDISGLELKGAPVPLEDRVGSETSGFETCLRTLHVTRMGCAAFSLGALDTCLRTTFRFARERVLYGQPVWSMAHPRAVITAAAVDLYVCEALVFAAQRAAHFTPAAVPWLASCVKYWVPGSACDAIADLAVILGARHYLREGPFSIFQKMQRDAALVPLFDGSSVVNLEQLVLALSRRRPSARGQSGMSGRFDIDASLPALDLGAIPALPVEFDETLSQWSDAEDRAASVGGALGEELIRLTRHFAQSWARVIAAAQGLSSADRRTPRAFALAREASVCTAAASCLAVWRFAAPLDAQLYSDPHWVRAALQRLARQPARADGFGVDDTVTEHVQRQGGSAQWFSLWPVAT